MTSAVGSVERQLTWKRVFVLLEHKIDAFADIDRDGDFGPFVEQLEFLVLLRGDVDGGADLFARHGSSAVNVYDNIYTVKAVTGRSGRI